MAQGHKIGDRQQGAPNTIIVTLKDVVHIAYENIGGHTALQYESGSRSDQRTGQVVGGMKGKG